MVSIERGVSAGKKIKLGTPFGKLAQVAREKVVRRYFPGMMERVSGELFLWNGEENIAKLEEPLREGAHLWIVMSHQSQAEASPATQIAKEVQDQFPKFVEHVHYVVAKSMGTGDQGAFLKDIYTLGVKENFERNNIEPIEVVSENDRKQRNLSSDLAAVRMLMSSFREKNTAMMVHVEGTMHSGRVNGSTSEINGMTEMDERFKKLLVKELKTGEDMVFLPVAMDKGYKIYDPDTRKFTKKGLKEIAVSELSNLWGVPYANPFGFVNIGTPFRGNEISGSSNPGEEIMKRIAKLMPPYARGIYK